jgi:hypothetical protein
MSALKKVAGLATGISAVAVIGVAVAQSVPPNPYRPNAPIAAGTQTVHMTPIGETGVLVEAPLPQPVATLTPQAEQAAVASPPAEPVAQAPAPAPDTTVAQAAPAPAPAPASEANTMGASPEPEPAPKSDRG